MRATKVNAGLAESNGRLLLGIWRDSLHVICGLTACTPGSAPGPTFGNEYGKTLPLPFLVSITFGQHVVDNIKTWTGLPVEESIRMTENRGKWRKYVHVVANPRIEDG